MDNMLDVIIINGKKYDFLSTYTIDNNNYVVYTDDDGIYVSQYIEDNGDLSFINIDENLEIFILNELGVEYE